MTKQLQVKIQNSIFPIRINEARYHNGDELIVDEKDLSNNVMEIIQVFEVQTPQDSPLNQNGDSGNDGHDDELEALKEKASELKIKGYTKMTVEELQAAINEKLATESE